MGLKLEQLPYQEKAIRSVVDIFKGQEKNTFDSACHFGIRSNIGTLSEGEIQNNIKEVSTKNSIPADRANLSSDSDICVEMETGTGKTLVYLKTIFELYKEYGFTKFIILVPSVPIREGVLSTLKTFGEQLKEIYGFMPNHFEYDSSDLNRVRNFIEAQHPQIMIMTVQSFNKDDNILNREQREDLFNNIPYVEAIGKTQPIIIMDEPQEGMDTENSVERIGKLNPFCKLRYSATHKVLKNLVYRLTPFDAYQEGLVKKIEVLSVAEKNDEATLKLELSRVQTKKGSDPKAKLNAWRWSKSAECFKLKETPWMSEGDKLFDYTENVSYRDYQIDRIYKDIRDQQFKIKFTNDIELVEKEQDKDFSGIFREQLYWLIRTHFQKRKILKKKGIKCLSLVFIDRVDNYIKKDGLVRLLFEEQYTKVYSEFNEGKEPSREEIETIQGSYFAKTQNGEFTDSEYSMSVNKEIYDRILTQKEELLSFDDSIEFIFSHSALGVGWDNPNVFNIATLNHSYSEIKKRQEIGRGLRICVNQNGQRVYDDADVEEGDELNLLTVVPNETYEAFVSQYQEQIKEAYGTTAAGAQTRHTHKGKKVSEKTIKRNEDLYNSDSFKEFWKRLGLKTNYTVVFDEELLISKAIEKINALTIPEYEAQITLNRIRELHRDTIEHEHKGSDTVGLKAMFTPMDIVEELSENTGLSYTATMSIVNGLTIQKEIAKNPPRFIQEASQIIKKVELDEMVRMLDYDTTGKRFDVSDLKKEFKTHAQTIKPTPNRGVYDNIVYDSKVEKDFAGYADGASDVVCFLKLPAFYQIPTPIGSYNPDFGIVVKKKKLGTEEESELHFVIETKNTNDIDDFSALTESQRIKIKCAQKHFEAIGIKLDINYNSFKGPIKDWQSFVSEAEIEYKVMIEEE